MSMNSDTVADQASTHPPVTDNLSIVQRRRKQFAIGAGLLMLPALFFAESMWPVGGVLHEGLEILGHIAILACIAGRTWCSLYIGGRKKQQLIQDGPYSISRNPLYLFSVIGGAGLGLQSGSLIAGLVSGLFVFALFAVVIGREEAFLKQRFPEEFAAYGAQVPRWGPRFSSWQTAAEISVQPRLVMVTFRDALMFLLSIPLMEGIELMQEAGWLPVLLHLP